VKSVPIGTLRHRMQLQQALRTADGGGGAVETWQTVADVWGAVLPISGEKRVAAHAISGRLTHEVWIRHRAGVTPSMRFHLDGRILEIRAVIAVDGRRSRFKCLCLERNL
jgi:SPP1 family predicted phage head-tail adaptor